jgi:hypothetical protein
MSFDTKSTGMKKLLNKMSLNMYGISVSEALSKGICVCCKEQANINDVEYNISGICEECQDGIFGEEE